MIGALFLPQTTLDQWLDAGHVDMGNDSLIFTADRTQFPMVPAVRFIKVVAGADHHKLIGKVKAVDAMRMGGAECSLGAVVLPDSAYEVEDGFMVTTPLDGAARPSPAPASAGAKPAGKEADLLAQFILNKLS